MLVVQQQQKVTRSTADGRTIVFESEKELDDARVDTVAQKIEQRQIARKNKDFVVADALRDELNALGTVIKDLPDGSTECTLI